MQTCDEEGWHTFKGVNFDLPVDYDILASPTDTLTGMRTDVDPKHPTTTIRLGRGVRLEGVLVNHKTGEPIPGKTVAARPADYRDVPYGRTIQAETDSQGRFVFKNLRPIAYRLRVDNTVPPGTEIIELPDGRRSIRYPGQLHDELKVQLPRETDEPYELRVVPY
jgi:hypothetical protein